MPAAAISIVDKALAFLFPLPLRFLALCLFGLYSFSLVLLYLATKWNLDAADLLQVSPLSTEADNKSEQNHRSRMLETTDSNTQSKANNGQLFFEQIRHLCLILSLLYIVFWLITHLTSAITSTIIIWSVILLVGLTPLHLSTWPVRSRFLACLKNVLLGSKVPTTPLADIVLADVLTSFSKVLADWDILFWCHLMIPSPISVDMQGAPQLGSATPASMCLPSIFSVFLVCLPYYCRFRQCISDYLSGVLRQPRHLINAVKYLTSFPIIYLSYLMLFPHTTGFYKRIWLICLGVNWIYTSCWDYFMDWDLGYSSKIGVQGHLSKFPLFLRPNLLFPVWSYYAVALLNLGLRGVWLVRIYAASVYPAEHPILKLWDSSSGVLLVQSIEITRRFIWLVFRFESIYSQKQPSEYIRAQSNVYFGKAVDN